MNAYSKFEKELKVNPQESKNVKDLLYYELLAEELNTTISGLFDSNSKKLIAYDIIDKLQSNKLYTECIIYGVELETSETDSDNFQHGEGRFTTQFILNPGADITRFIKYGLSIEKSIGHDGKFFIYSVYIALDPFDLIHIFKVVDKRYQIHSCELYSETHGKVCEFYEKVLESVNN